MVFKPFSILFHSFFVSENYLDHSYEAFFFFLNHSFHWDFCFYPGAFIFSEVSDCFSFMHTIINLNTNDISSTYSSLFLFREFGPFWASIAGWGSVLSGSLLICLWELLERIQDMGWPCCCINLLLLIWSWPRPKSLESGIHHLWATLLPTAPTFIAVSFLFCVMVSSGYVALGL